MAGLDPLTVAKMLEVLSPVRPAQLRMSSGLGNLAATLRGGTQPANQLLTQLASRPGVQKGALSRVFGHVDPAQKMSPMELSSQARSPKLYAQRSMTGGHASEDQIEDLALDTLYGPDMAEARELVYRRLLGEISHAEGIAPEYRRQAAQMMRAMPSANWEYNAQALIDAQHTDDMARMEALHELMPQARALAAENIDIDDAGRKALGPAFKQYQRQDVPGPHDAQGGQYFERSPNYFETVLRGAPSLGRRGSEGGVNAGVMQPDESFHFSNPSQLGHVRGSVDPSGRVFAEELQSDPLEVADAAQLPELSGIYGKLGRMLIDRSAEAGAPSVSFPSAERIASVRNKSQLPFFKSVYDKDLDKQLYRPLQERGVSLTQDDGWTTMGLPPDLVEAIRGGKLLDYKQGGPVQPWWRSAKGGLSKASK